jgi:outer membrane protein
MRCAMKLLVLSTVLAALPASAQEVAEGRWLVRARAVHLDMDNRSSAIPALAVPGDAIRVEDKTIPELDISYFLTKNLAAELILTYPQKHDVKVGNSAIGAFKAGSFKHLPPTLTVQWHFNPEGIFRPYLGAGVNYTRITSESLAVPGVTRLRLESDSWGGAVQAGFDVEVGKNMFVNFDVKKVQIRSNLYAASGKVARLKLDPLLVGVGFGYRF